MALSDLYQQQPMGGVQPLSMQAPQARGLASVAAPTPPASASPALSQAGYTGVPAGVTAPAGSPGKPAPPQNVAQNPNAAWGTGTIVPRTNAQPNGAPNANGVVTGTNGFGVQTNAQGNPVVQGLNPTGGPGSSLATAAGLSEAGVANGETNWNKYNITLDPNYQSYLQQSAQAQQQGANGGALINPASLANYNNAAQFQAGLASAPSAAQVGGLAAANTAATGGGVGGRATQGSLALLQQAAQGNGPTAADITQGQGISAALRSQLSAAASARGGAYTQAAAQEQAQGQMGQTSLQGANAAAQLRAQEQQTAEAQYASAAGNAYQTQAGAAGTLATAANQQYGLQTQAAQNATQNAAGQQTSALQYYEGQQNAYQTEAGLAANLAQAQVANDYGLGATQLQTQTQQAIANQNQTAQYIGAGVGAAGAVIAAAASTGGAEAAAKGARDAGASPELAARIGAHVGQRIGDTRGIRTPETEQADARAAAEQAAKKPRGMTEDEARAHLAMLRKGRPDAAADIPRGARYEPAAPAAYQAGSQLAQLAARYGRAG